MAHAMSVDKRRAIVAATAVGAGLIIAVGTYSLGYSRGASRDGSPRAAAATPTDRKQAASEGPRRASADPLTARAVDLSPSEFAQFKVRPVAERLFTIRRQAVGTIDFNQDMSVSVFPPVPGKIISLFARAGDDVTKGTPLYTLDSPDLAQAESNLIAATGMLNLANRALERAKRLFAADAIARKDLDQATSDQQTAEGAAKAARNALRVFGKTDTDADSIIAGRRIDPVLVVPSPITGRVTARTAAPGLLVQPGAPPAPYVLSDVATMWMLANVAETDFPLLRMGEKVDVNVKAYPGRTFKGTIVYIGTAVDPTTHRIVVRSEIPDPKHELRPGMFATYVIHTDEAVRSPAVPLDGLVREGDGSMTVWVASDGGRLVKRTVTVGLEDDGFAQILEGVRPGELVATEGALFLSNALTAASR